MTASIINYLEICRTCLSQRVEMISLFSLQTLCEKIAQINEVIMECASVEVCKGDGLPEQVCVQCFEELKRIFMFKKLCEQSDITLRGHLVKKEEPQCEDETGGTFTINKQKANEQPSEGFDSNWSSDNKFGEGNCNYDCEEDVYGLADKDGTQEQLSKAYNCNKCDTTFKLKSTYRKHLSLEHIELNCQHCEKNFKDKTSLENHRCMLKPQENTEKRKKGRKKQNLPTTCDVCNKTFPYHSNLERHKLTHTGEKAFLCNTCGRRFAQLSQLTVHSSIHTGEKPYRCDMCNKSFTAPSTLLTHKRTHTGERPHKCQLCGKHFRQTSCLKTHIRTHTGEKPFKCTVCEKDFSQGGRLAMHMRMHSGERPYQCYVCGKTYGDKMSLKKHVRLHTGERPYDCGTCGQKFRHAGLLATHRKIHQVKDAGTDIDGSECSD